MKVFVRDIVSHSSNIVVLFSTNFGDAIAAWKGEVPVVNQVYDVEVDINDALIWNKDVTMLDGDGNYFIQMENGHVIFYGCLDSIDDDGYTVLRIDDSIIPFMTIGEAAQVGSFIRLSVKSISLWPLSYC